jgi:hypothetical protein
MRGAFLYRRTLPARLQFRGIRFIALYVWKGLVSDSRAFEESRHGLAFREYLIRSGLRSDEEFEALEKETFSRRWKLPFQTARQMACYGALQESATYTACNLQRNIAPGVGDQVLEAIFFLKSQTPVPDGQLQYQIAPRRPAIPGNTGACSFVQCQ